MRFTKLSQSMLCVARYPRTMYLTLLPHNLKLPIPCQNGQDMSVPPFFSGVSIFRILSAVPPYSSRLDPVSPC